MVPIFLVLLWFPFSSHCCGSHFPRTVVVVPIFLSKGGKTSLCFLQAVRTTWAQKMYVFYQIILLIRTSSVSREFDKFKVDVLFLQAARYIVRTTFTVVFMSS